MKSWQGAVDKLDGTYEVTMLPPVITKEATEDMLDVSSLKLVLGETPGEREARAFNRFWNRYVLGNR